jgi:hypothetical protein
MEEVELNISDLYPMTWAKAINELSAILENEEIEQPIVVLLTDKATWAAQKLAVPFINDPPDVEDDEIIMQIRCGHNRVEYLKRKGIDKVRALVYIDSGKAGEECFRQQKWHKQKYGALI